MAGHQVDDELIRRLAALLGETGLTEIEYETKDWRVRVGRQGPAAGNVAITVPAPAAVAPAPVTVAPAAGGGAPAAVRGAVISPVVGTAYVAPEPTAPPFVRVGDKVKQGQTVLIVEAMKVMNPILAPQPGTVAQVFVANGQPVEFGEVLMVIE
ncbi:MAG: acetyl-CoA carboxylase biotin carboxyl carrier protein [Alphaproteobacteria bacterium]|nr:acetyl-CoA carboxylase biotin carboxyl carrier protein [Alphaproteobacteria bacterium]